MVEHEDNTTSFCIEYNNRGALFVHAVADGNLASMAEGVSPPPSSYLAVIHGEDSQTLTLCSAAGDDDRELLVKEMPLQFRGKSFRASCGEWIIVWGDINNSGYSLWNPLTAEIVGLPDPTDLHPESKIGDRILTSPPGNPNSMVILYEKGENSFRYCRIRDLIWHKQLISSNLDDEVDGQVFSLINFVTCDWRIYCRSTVSHKLVVIDIKPDGLDMSIFNAHVPWYREPRWYCGLSYLVESGGELFYIILFLNETTKNSSSVGAIHVLRLNIASEEWTKIESFPDRAFFLGHSSRFSCPAPQPGIQANHVYFQFTDRGDCSLYSLNMKDKTVLCSLPCPKFSDSCHTCLWIKSDSRLIDLNRKSKQECICLEEETKFANGGVMKPATIEGDFGMFDLDIQLAIASCLKLQDYLRFRVVNSWFRSIAPPIRWTKSVLEGYEGYDSLPPWLMLWEVGRSICTFIDPLCDDERYFMSIPHCEENYSFLFYAKGGWCLVVQGNHRMIIWNPFSKTIIPLPHILSTDIIAGCGFSSSPDSPDCAVALIFRFGLKYWLDYTYLGGEVWRRYSFKRNGLDLYTDNHPVFLNGAFYFLDDSGKLGIFRESEDIQVDEDGDVVLNHLIDSPCEFFHQKFLLECDGKLLSVFVGFLGRFVRIFKLDDNNTVWLEVETLGDYTLYLNGRFSAFSAIATRGLQNRVYFNRYYGKSVVYYSLDSKQLHSHDSGEALENFYNTKEQLLCSWLSPRF